ncbi:right-handed parallel beta-helix repeat-containing protein [Pseudarthrobacter sp. MEB009]|uniref:right-handed parallel beta-helix repeat-containing protein n=1 Tax=Pseudarthrobacter sp. MEB009 TaxID=3040326 RepID=UPI002556E38F|nr:right-handed parallel beta-helix repeat-containing protein [Pseudarthrobacter sp. MEB009]
MTFSNPFTFLGNEATRTEISVQSTAGVVWSATGQPIDDFPEVEAPGVGQPGSVTLPFVDQPGFTDQAGNAFTMWAYRITRKSVFGNTQKTVTKNWQPLIGQDVVDFDNLPGGVIGLPVSAPVVPVTSVAGLTLAVGAAELASELEEYLPGGVTPEEVQEAVSGRVPNAAKGAASGVAPLDTSAKVPDTNLPARLGDAALSATYVGLRTVDLETFLLPGETLPSDDATDARPLFQRALDAAAALVPSLGPVTIRIPSGKYRIYSSLRWFNNYHVGFVGAGRSNTRILPHGNAVFGLMDPGFDPNGYLDDQVFADMTIDCTNQVSTPNNVGAKGIALRYMRNGRFERVRVINSWATSFGCDFLQDVRFTECSAIRSGRGVTGGHDSFGAGFGIGVGNYDIESVSFVNCYAEDSWSAGFFVERILEIPRTPSDSRGFSMTGCTSLGGYNGLRDAGADGLVVNGCHFLNASNAGIHIEGYPLSGRHGGRNGIINASVIRGNATGVLVGNASTGAYTFDNNEITANTAAGVTAAAGGQLGAGWRWLNNRIERNGTGGIDLGSVLVARPEIRGNVIRENGTGDGIRIAGDTFDPRIIDNVIQGHIGAGINFAGSGQFCTTPAIRGNTVTENSRGWLVNEKATDDVTGISGNREQAAFNTITNEFTTPSYELNVSLAAALSRFDAPVQMTDGGKYGTSYARFTVNQDGSPTARVGRVSGAVAGPRVMSYWVRTTKGAVIRPFAIGYWESNGKQRTYNKGGIRATGDWQRVSLGITLPSNGSRVDINMAIDGAVSGQTVDIDGVNLTAGTALWPYIDGTQPNCAWTGTAGSSSSVWTVGTSGAPTLADKLLTQTGQSPLASQTGATIGTGLSIPLNQSMTLYAVHTTPAASQRASLRTSTSADRFATGRNSGNSAWVAIGTDSAAASFNAQVTAASAPGIIAAVRDAAGITAHVRGLSPVTTAVASYDPATATRLVNDNGVSYSVVYAGVHDATMRAAVMDLLATEFGVA